MRVLSGHRAPADRTTVPRRGGSRGWRLHRPWFLPEGRRLSDEVWLQRHRALTWLLWAHVPALYLFGTVRGFSTPGLVAELGVPAVAGAVAMVQRGGRVLRSSSVCLGLVISASVLVQLSGGAIEAHFEYFVLLAVLTLYQSWLPYLLALSYVVVEHAVIGALDPRAVFNTPSDIAHPWRWAAIHGGFVVAAGLTNVLSWRLTEQEALRDALTGLPNRVALLDALDKTLGGPGRDTCAVLYLDLDNFKDANDAFGHQVGDALLRALSRRLKHQLRAVDFLARLGGDEFAIVLTDVADMAAAITAAERIRGSFEEVVRLGDISLAALASIGVALPDADTASAADLLRNADLAMYEAKREGGGQVAPYAPMLHTAALRRTELEGELRVALRQGEFLLHYQPIMNLTTGTLVGTEALIRWQHPTRGLLSPADFISAAEQSGLIIAIGTWVLRTACQQTAEWQRGDPHGALTVAVNLSPRQLLDRTLVTTVAEALYDSGLAASSLCLEITEGSVIKDFESTMPTLHALRRLGVSLALDDFGTGYSSLSYLKQLPVNSVKIDQSFVGDLGTDHPNAEIVLAIIGLAHALGMSVTAEGAETDEQLAILKAMRSDQAQGYLLGRPMLGSALSDVLDRPATASVPSPRPASDLVPAPRPASDFVPAPRPASDFVPAPRPATNRPG